MATNKIYSQHFFIPVKLEINSVLLKLDLLISLQFLPKVVVVFM